MRPDPLDAGESRELAYSLDRARLWCRLIREARAAGKSHELLAEMKMNMRWWAMRWRTAPGSPCACRPASALSSQL